MQSQVRTGQVWTRLSSLVFSRPGNNSGLSGILEFGSEIFCLNAVVATQEIVIVHCESLESELLTEKN